MAYYTKEQYDSKREYAYRISSESQETISQATGIDNDALDILSELSHKRHELHCNSERIYLYNYHNDLNEVGVIYSNNDGIVVDEGLEDSLIHQVNALHLVNDECPYIKLSLVDDDDSSENIFAEFGEDIPEAKDESELRDYALECLCYNQSRLLDAWSDSAREWFGKINEKYGTNYPC